MPGTPRPRGIQWPNPPDSWDLRWGRPAGPTPWTGPSAPSRPWVDPVRPPGYPAPPLLALSRPRRFPRLRRARRPHRHRPRPRHPPPRATEPTMRKSCRPAAGFTLIEILVALLILGIMSALGYGTYRAARISAERTEESLKRSREIEFGMRMMVQDIAQAVPRPVRDILGQNRLPAMQGTGGVGTLSQITSSSSTSSGMSFSSP